MTPLTKSSNVDILTAPNAFEKNLNDILHHSPVTSYVQKLMNIGH